MRLTLIGLGGGTPDTMTTEAAEALEQADAVIGAERLLESLPEGVCPRRIAAVQAPEIVKLLEHVGAERPCVVYSGDPGFYSGVRLLLPLLTERGIEYRLLPGISSVQLLSARLGRPWQAWTLRSAHGTDCDPVAAVMEGKPAFFLTGGAQTPASLCRVLTDAGLGALRVWVGERLSYPDERVSRMTAAECAERTFAPLSVLLSDAAPRPWDRCGGIPDEAFIRGEVPMTKQLVRAAILAKLGIKPTDVLWDVGAGTGSVSVELALSARRGRTFAVEYREKALSLIRANREKFGTWNLTAVEGRAPEALSNLPSPDAVFIGGSDGALAEIVDAVLKKNPAAGLCISAIALETLSKALDLLSARGLEAEVTQLAVSGTKPAGRLHLLTANNPTFLITVDRRDET